LLFRADSSKGVVFYLHGNGGKLDNIRIGSKFYTDLGYDFFMADYRGYHKSEGSINSETQLHEDNQMLYDKIKKSYSEEDIIIVGYSLGGSLAAKLASNNHPKYLVLQAPFCGGKAYKTKPRKEADRSFPTLMMKIMPMKLLLKYTLKTNEFLKSCTMPVLIFHGNDDQGTHYGSSVKLKEDFKPGDRLIILEGQGHKNITSNAVYQEEVKKLLDK
jgi:uncharacterized protein